METPKPKSNTGLKKSKKVRVVAKIRGFPDLETESANWVCVYKPNGEDSDFVTVSFGEQPSSRNELLRLDYCYEQNEGNGTIFSREVKPLISGVLDGFDATIIASGAKTSGKTHVIQGSDKEPGLAALAVAEILSMSEEIGKSITISFYEIFQDHVYDLLDPKRPEVQVLEDGKGKIQLKGLSQVPVKSIPEFQKLYIGGDNSQKSMQKIAPELPRRSHKGLIVHVSSVSDPLPVGKINFVDFAGYEDARRKSIEGLSLVESTKVNKSIYALHNVVYALNANESHVPYRESKLTRMLQDSLGEKSRILMITCLNPSFCHDSLYMVSLASRCCQGNNQTLLDTTRKTKSSARPMLPSSHKNQLPRSVSITKKQIGSQMQYSIKNANGVTSVMKGRKLFDEASHSTKSKKMAHKASSSSDIASTIKFLVQEQREPYLFYIPTESSSSEIASTIKSLVQEQESSVTDAMVDEGSTALVEKDASPFAIVDTQETTESSVTDAMVDEGSTSLVEKDASPFAIVDTQETTDSFLNTEEDQGKVTCSVHSSLKALSLVDEGQGMEKENNYSLINKDKSPPISERLQEISNNLKQLISSTPLCIEIPPKNNTSLSIDACADIAEPKTPDQSRVVDDKWDCANMKSPWETFSMCSVGMKNSLVQECLSLLNTGSKEDLKRLKGIGEKRADYILQLREESPEPFKNLDDLKDIGFSAKQIKGMMRKEVGDLFN